MLYVILCMSPGRCWRWLPSPCCTSSSSRWWSWRWLAASRSAQRPVHHAPHVQLPGSLDTDTWHSSIHVTRGTWAAPAAECRGGGCSLFWSWSCLDSSLLLLPLNQDLNWWCTHKRKAHWESFLADKVLMLKKDCSISHQVHNVAVEWEIEPEWNGRISLADIQNWTLY